MTYFLKAAVYIFCTMLIFIQSAQATEYRILITNDDGVDNPGLIALADELSKSYQVIVSAPAKNMSGSSHGTHLFKGPMKVDKRTGKNYVIYAVHGMPADAARFGIVTQKNKGKPVDLVISGINPGSNIGSLSHLSGTIGAGMEAALNHIPAIALNLDRKAIKAHRYGKAISLVQKVIKKIQSSPMPEGTMLNINIPVNNKGIKIVPMGPELLWVESFGETDKGQKPKLKFHKSKPEDASNDVTAYQNGYVAITPLKLDWTAYKMLAEIRKWKLE